MTGFDAICAALWGPHYRGVASALLGLHRRDVQRMANGQRPVPDDLQAALLDRLAAHDKRCDDLLRRAQLRPAEFWGDPGKE